MTVETTPWCGQAPLMGYLQALGTSPLAPAEEESEIEPPLMLHASLALTLQQAVAQEVGLEVAVAAWQQTAERLMRRHRQHRAGTLLASLEEALAAPEALRQALEEKGLAVPLANDAKPVTPPVAPFYHLLAEHLIQHREPLRAQVRLLEALSLPLGNAGVGATYPDAGKEALDSAAALQMHLNGQAALDERPRLQEALTQVQGEKQALQEESRLLLEQLHGVQEALEERTQAHDKAGAAFKSELEQQRRQAEEQGKTATRHRQEAEQARKEVEQARKEAEQKGQEAEQTRKEAGERQETVKVLREELHNLTQQLEIQRAEQVNLEKALEEESQLLLEQLHLVQEELERVLLERRAEQEEQALAALSPREQQLRRLRESEWFDTDWYLAQYPDVRESGADPLEHYLMYGARLGRNPGPRFDTQAYLTRYPDVAATDINPLYHFVLYGHAENRNPGRLESEEA